MTQWTQDHYEKNKERLCANSRARRVSNWAKYKIIAIRQRCKRNGNIVPFEISEADVLQPTHCPVLGVELDYDSKEGSNNNTASIDRIIPALGYVPGNIITVSMKANRIKNDATVDEIGRVHEFYSRLDHPFLQMAIAAIKEYNDGKTKEL